MLADYASPFNRLFTSVYFTFPFFYKKKTPIKFFDDHDFFLN